jgi:hypothetical protein
MNKIYLCAVVFTLFTHCITVQNVTIPDFHFKANWVGNSTINSNSYLEIQVIEATKFTGTINCQNRSIYLIKT